MLTLTGTNSYTGGTTVSNGTLLVNGALAGGAVNVKSNATLGGSGVIAGGVSVAAGGVLRPGLGGADTSPLAFGSSLSLTGATVIAISRANVPNASTLTGITALTRGGTLTVTNVGPAPVAGDSFPLFSAASSSGNFTATNLPALDAGLNWWPSNNYAALVVNGSPVVSNFLMGAISGVTNRFKLIGSQFAPAGEAGETLTVTAVGAAAHGPATTDGTNLIYVATNGFAGADSFTYTVSDGRGGTATATVTVNVILGGTNLSRLTPVGGTGGVLVYSNLAGFNCVLDWATNLSPANWQPLLTNTAAPTNGLISFTNALVAPRNFFRTRHAP
ncbi:MAG: Ig-like domain-containing protein [Verrucomicrobia bacterium]|nr:Ig-like domain-containing protein [Verrucomicrobiota bacterium]